MSKVYKTRQTRRNLRSRGDSRGTITKPRICVFRSNKHIYVQAMNDLEGKIISSSSSVVVKVKGTKSEISEEVGKTIGKNLLDAKIEQVVFDRNGFKYHGRVKKLAEGVRASGVKF